MKGKLIVIEGIDGSGKATQSQLLHKNLKALGHNVLSVSFPDYESKSSELAKMYLNGDFGNSAESVNPYMASVFFAADRVASYKTKWQKDLENGKIIIADRYTTSNMIHQASKFCDEAEKNRFLDWVFDFEYTKLELPKPDVTIFLDMPVSYSQNLIKERKNKFSKSDEKDIHECDVTYLNQSYENAYYVAKKYGWEIIKCVDNGCIRTIEDISSEILFKVNKIV